MPHYRHKTSKAVIEANSSPGDDWVRVAGPENVTPPRPGSYDAASARPASSVVIDDGAGGPPFDPSAHTVAEVTDHLATAGAAERDRVLAAEESGKARSSILSA